VPQYSETNVMQLSFDLLTIKGLYMFRALLGHPQKGATQAALGILRAYHVSGLHDMSNITCVAELTRSVHCAVRTGSVH
jgi:hypothetical protein